MELNSRWQKRVTRRRSAARARVSSIRNGAVTASQWECRRWWMNEPILPETATGPGGNEVNAGRRCSETQRVARRSESCEAGRARSDGINVLQKKQPCCGECQEGGDGSETVGVDGGKGLMGPGELTQAIYHPTSAARCTLHAMLPPSPSWPVCARHLQGSYRVLIWFSAGRSKFGRAQPLDGVSPDTSVRYSRLISLYCTRHPTAWVERSSLPCRVGPPGGRAHGRA